MIAIVLGSEDGGNVPRCWRLQTPEVSLNCYTYRRVEKSPAVVEGLIVKGSDKVEIVKNEGDFGDG
jgi:hypothetical protein